MTVRGDTDNIEKHQHDAEPCSPSLPSPGPQSSLCLVCSLISRRDVFSLLFPAVGTSVVAGGVAPFMIHVLGQVFDAFARFPLTDAMSQDKSALRHDVGIAAIKLVALAAGAIALRSVMSALWIATGERNVMHLRKKVYEAVTTRETE